MKIKTLCVVLLFFATSTLYAAQAPLFRMTSNAGQAANGNQPSMVFQEVERSETSSTVEAVQTSGSVAAKSMFLLSGSCALMKERKKEAFKIERLSKQPIRFIVRFVSGENIGNEAFGQPIGEDAVIPAARCDLIQSVLAR
ncbi:hypothetical protein [Massilia horti]|uniref:Uncharacterized protein n=1 Tax=Massilia horti TaxID=2562153 RepID=A0A4Y9SRA1_9BURK|nr:hypothetical protein [Massilia horti]TFW29121.1 hypothetical protein E4O92_19655 [Massilia horti]